MDDDLILNVEFTPSAQSSLFPNGAPGHTSPTKQDVRRLAGNSAQDGIEPPIKRRKIKPSTSFDRKGKAAQSTSKPHWPIVSSLFTSNPSFDLPKRGEPSIVLQPSNAPLSSISTFAHSGLHKLLVRHLSEKMGFKTPTAIQRASLELVLNSTAPGQDLFIQSQTGSGKTLAFLLPLVHDLLPLSTLSYIDRSIGTLGIIVAPTRELAKQISDVLETLLQLKLSPASDEADTNEAPRLTRWLVSGLLVGGATRTHQKARLRKGVPILVATPGRLLDHLQNTESFRVAKCRWLIFDEADRLMELGFQETLTDIIKALDGRRRMAMSAAEEGGGYAGEAIGGWDWSIRRRTVLCSATLRDDVEQLAGMTLDNPVMINADNIQLKASMRSDLRPKSSIEAAIAAAPPTQLSQRYTVVPLKLRLVTLIALLRSTIKQSHEEKMKSKRSNGVNIIVFLDCTDSVDFHWALLGNAQISEDAASEETLTPIDPASKVVTVSSSFLPGTSVFRLHGALPLSARQESVREFSTSTSSSEAKKGSAISSRVMLCTSVASRGLDLPEVRTVIQYDLPTEGGCNEYIHRVGRTARAGKSGEAWAFVSPEEASWIPFLEAQLAGTDTQPGKAILAPFAYNDILAQGFGGRHSDTNKRATDIQLACERWVITHDSYAQLAQRAFKSHMKAYSTHPAPEKHIFHVRNLHLGHLAKAFALRQAPGELSSEQIDEPKQPRARNGSNKPSSTTPTSRNNKSGPLQPQRKAKLSVADRMKAALSARNMTKGSNLGFATSVDEFQVAGTAVLSRMRDLAE